MTARSTLVFLATAIAPLTAHAQGTPRAPRAVQVTVRVENTLAAERRDETIAVEWAAVRERLPDIAPGRVRVRDGSGAELVTQALDANGDGVPDSLLFQASFFGRETRLFTVDAEAPQLVAKPKVRVKFVPERTDVAWESDRIAFRTYGQLLWQLENLHSSGLDVWVKRTRDLVLDSWYAAGPATYHVDRGEGGDFFRVGATLGGGATAIWRNGNLYRAENFRTHRIIAEGPIRAIFELDFDPWDAAGLRVTETKRIAIDAGHNLFWQQSVFHAAGADSVQYAIGFVKRPGLVGSTSRARPWAWLTGWGPMAGSSGDAGHGELGTAVILNRNRVVDMKETSDHYVVVASARSGEPLVHLIGAGWTGSRDFAGVQEWWAYLDHFAARMTNPVKVTLQ